MNEEIVKNWIQLAKDDLKTARHEMNSEDPVFRSVCFRSQQCVEKFLKAFLTYHDKEIRKNHDITELIKACAEVDNEFEEMPGWNADYLTKYSVVVRYPDEIYFPSRSEAKESIEIAEKVKEFVLDRIAVA